MESECLYCYRKTDAKTSIKGKMSDSNMWCSKKCYKGYDRKQNLVINVFDNWFAHKDPFRNEFCSGCRSCAFKPQEGIYTTPSIDRITNQSQNYDDLFDLLTNQ